MLDSKNTSDSKKRTSEKRSGSAEPEDKPVKGPENEKFSPGEPDDYNADEFATD